MYNSAEYNMCYACLPGVAIRSHWLGAACAEMEAGAIAQVAHAFRVPFLAVRALSDVTGHDDNPMEFEKFTEVAAENTARFIRTWCACL